MHIYGIGILRRWARRALIATQPHAVILLYHRVAKLKSDPQLLSVTPGHFAEHLEHLREHYHPISLNELAKAIEEKRVPNRAVAITFDDGYVDNLRNAKPLLEKYEIPSTVFVTSGYVGQNREFWWDELERLLLLPESLPDSLTVTINNKIYSWNTESQEKDFDYEKYRQWNVTMTEIPTSRNQAYIDLCNLLRPMDNSSREEILNQIINWAGLENTCRPDYRAMSADEVRSLIDDGLIEVGGHTQTHPVLASLSPHDQVKEIEGSKKFLEAIIGQPVTTFSYPYGGLSDYTMDTVAIVQNSGFSCVCSNFPGVVLKGSDCFQLPRFLVRNWNGEEFARRLKECFHG